ncbi:MAG: secondary thiamine-phosphate synthase enzyme YjbQ [Deltaproteobacteria bacterium]|nr:secondary thiamine-phosphate synthase enzyme YjbQ [Deltaproteobacteria bacterium]
MAVVTKTFKLSTQGESEIHDVTEEVAEGVRRSGVTSGTVTIFVSGSTAALTTIEFEDGVVRDLTDAIERLAPRDIHYAHDARWGDMNGYSHVRASMLGPSLVVPFSDGKLLLGTWQQIVLIDFDNRPRKREIILQVMGD